MPNQAMFPNLTIHFKDVEKLRSLIQARCHVDYIDNSFRGNLVLNTDQGNVQSCDCFEFSGDTLFIQGVQDRMDNTFGRCSVDKFPYYNTLRMLANSYFASQEELCPF
jgi:hypothetical protein